MIVIKGSGRGADAIVSIIEGTEPTDTEVLKRKKKAVKIGVHENMELFEVFHIERGSVALADQIERLLDEQ